MDVSNATDVEVIPLKHAIAMDLAPLVQRLLESGSGVSAVPGAQADGSFKTTLLAESRSNTLILRAANPARLALAKTLIEQAGSAQFPERHRQHLCGVSEKCRCHQAGCHPAGFDFR
jgi:general secretion pathway protein D